MSKRMNRKPFSYIGEPRVAEEGDQYIDPDTHQTFVYSAGRWTPVSENQSWWQRLCAWSRESFHVSGSMFLSWTGKDSAAFMSWSDRMGGSVASNEPAPPYYVSLKGSDLHFHKDERGHLIRCYHAGVNLVTDWKFWAGMTIGFPFEHFLYERVWPFTLITRWMGL